VGERCARPHREVTRTGRTAGPKPPPQPPPPTSQGDGQGTSEPLGVTMPSGVAEPDASSVSTTRPRDGADVAAQATGPVNRITAAWQGGQRFDTGREGGPTARLDGANETGQSPVDALLSALATCSGVDVVEILAKRRTPVERFRIDVTATRRAEAPRRVLRFDIDYRIDGSGIDREQAERAIKLAIEKYCTVASTLNSDVVIMTTLTLNGEPGEARRQAVPG
jgi:putative redox protein